MTELIELMPYAVSLVAAVLAFVLGRFLKITITVAQLMPVVTAIFESILKTEKNTASIKRKDPDFDAYRESMAVEILEKRISESPKKKKALWTYFGTAAKAIAYVFPYVKPIIDGIFKK